MLNLRSSDIVNNLDTHVYHILGCGAIGSSAATQLARMGAKQFALYDMDKVGIENVGVSQYSLDDVGKAKTTALAKKLEDINVDVDIMELDERFTSILKYDQSSIAILGFDNMKTRLEAVQNMFIKDGPNMLIDGRMGAEHYQQYTFIGKNILKEYKDTWYSDEEGTMEPCTAKATSYCSNMSGSFIVNAIRKVLTNQPYEKELVFNFPAMFLTKNTCFKYVPIVN